MTTAPDLVRAAYAHYLQKGDPPHIAAAKAGNLRLESSGNTTIRGDGGKAFGSFQWHPDRQVNLANFAASTGGNINDQKTQLDFFDWELANSEKAAGQKLAASTDLRGANDAILASLRPSGYSSGDPTASAAYDTRLRYGAELLGAADGGNYIGPHDLPVADAAVAASPPGTAATGLLGNAKADALVSMGKSMMEKGHGGKQTAEAPQMPEDYRPQVQAPGLFNAYRKRAGLLGSM